MTTLIQTGFGADSNAVDVIAGIDLTGKRAIITGGASGIGIETARALALAGAEVVLAVRDVVVGQRVATELSTSTVKPVRVERLDLASRASIADFAARWRGPLHLLINNAAVMANPLTRTAEGWELQFATNHIGHFAVTTALHRALKDAAGARIVNVSSSGHLRAPVMFDDVQFEHRAYDPWVAYGQSKTANVLFSVELTRRWQSDGIFANALMPGGIMTNLQRYVSQQVLDNWAEMEKAGKMKMKTPAQGAATTIVAAASPLLAGIGGRYFEDCNEAATVANDIKASRGVRAWALDPTTAEQLWQRSEAWLKG
jgi:NAD(P)-dependent dehydrogenase (short-subunit alcohol dehydrogenase family)